ncbi:sigma-70 family RNA polymerase sigma factor [Paenibacillus sp. SI8]|uniref:sigma-70 family RNA polymerase sigma factor n=1 Tax=unclassified Paenibacillus TaxID=185978 RepID=UPI003466BBFB
MTEQEWQQSLQRMSQGDQDAFRRVYNESREQVYRTVTLLMTNKNDICDVVSEVYAELFRSIPKYDARWAFRGWLNGIIVRQCRSWNRKLWRKWRLFERSKLLENHEKEPGSEEIFMRQESKNELFQLLQVLSYKHRSVLVLRYYQECSFEEIADILEIPVGTAKSRHHNALEKLRLSAHSFTFQSMKEDSPHVYSATTKNSV